MKLRDTSLQIKYLLDDNFTLVPDTKDPQHFSVAILKGPYEGVVYKYDVIEINEENGFAKFSFSYSLLANDDVVSNSKDFEQHITSILDEVLENLPKESIQIK